MSQEFSELNLTEDFQKVLLTPDAARWKLEKAGPLEIWAKMHPIGNPNEIFQAYLLWPLYPDDPPSIKFRDPASGRLDIKSVWPRVRGFRPDSFDICVNWSLEGFKLHPEWKSDPCLRWDSRGNVLLKVLRTMQFELDNFFEGRFK